MANPYLPIKYIMVNNGCFIAPIINHYLFIWEIFNQQMPTPFTFFRKLKIGTNFAYIEMKVTFLKKGRSN